MLVFGIQSNRFFTPSHHTPAVYNDLLDGDPRHGGQQVEVPNGAESEDSHPGGEMDGMSSIESCRPVSTPGGLTLL
jgi:hypothetical protein